MQSIELSPGELRASVRGSRPDHYTTTLSLRQLSDDQWDAVLDLAMSKASNIAALLAGEVPPEIGDHVLPDRGDLSPECSCPDWAEPCKHAAALCYIAADMFDADPFALLTLRGRSRDRVLTEVRERRSERLGVDSGPPSDQPRGADPTISAAQAFRREPVPLEQAPLLPARPGAMVPLAVLPGHDAGIDETELADLVGDAAQRAWAMLAGGAPSQLDLTLGADVVRRAVTGDIESISSATGVPIDELEAAVAAWSVGGLDGFQVHRQRPDTDPEALQPAKDALGDKAKIRSDGVNLGTTQLRLDSNNRWWRFTADEALGWLLIDGPADDPNDLLGRDDQF